MKVIIFIVTMLFSFNLFSQEEINENYKMNFNVENTIKKYDILITHENNISDVIFKIYKCKACTQRDLNDDIICTKNRNVFVTPIYCKAPKSLSRNNISSDVGYSTAALTCMKLTSKILCKVKVTTRFNNNLISDKNALTKLGNLTLEYIIIDKD